MATKKEIADHLKTALNEIGKIEPWFDKEVNAWIFEHPSYPVGYAGKTSQEVIKMYPLHLSEFISERLKDNLDPLVEKHTKGHGGLRHGAGRPFGSIKESSKQIRVPLDIADWIKQPGIIPHLREMLRAYKHT